MENKIIEHAVIQCLNYDCMKPIIIKFKDSAIDNDDDIIYRNEQIEIECPHCKTIIALTLHKRIYKMDYRLQGLFIAPKKLDLKELTDNYEKTIEWVK